MPKADAQYRGGIPAGRLEEKRRDLRRDFPEAVEDKSLAEEFFRRLFSENDHPSPLKGLREVLHVCCEYRAFELAEILLPGPVLGEAAPSEGIFFSDSGLQEVEEFVAGRLEVDKQPILVVRPDDALCGEIPENLRDRTTLLIPVALNANILSCNRVDCRFRAWSEGAEGRPSCAEAHFYPGECCFKKDLVPPVPITHCRQCPIFPFAFVLVLSKEELGPADMLVAELLRHKAYYVAQELRSSFIMGKYNQLTLAMNRVSMKMSELLDFNKRMELLLGTSLAISGADRGSIFIYDEEREQLKYVAWHNMPEHIEFDAPRRADTGIAAWVARNGCSLLLQDNVDNEFYKGIDPSVRSAISMPLFSKGEVFGVLNLSITTPGQRFCEADLRLVERLAYIGTMGIENAFLYRRMEEKEILYRKLLAKMISAQEDERKKIASDIHDDTIQSLISSYYQLETVEMLLDADSREAAMEEIRKIKSGLQRNISCMRRLLFDLRPSILDDAGLVPALENYLDRLENEYGIRGFLYVDDGMERLPSDVEISLYRFAQEILTNVRKHANATEVVIRLNYSRNWVEMRIKDNGIGFDPEKYLNGCGHEEHFGLKSLIERVELADGEISIDTAPGKGTEVRIRIPGK